MGKRIFKYIGIALLLLMGLLIAIANFGTIFWEKSKREYAKTLEGMVADINSHLPMKSADGFDFFIMEHVSIEGNSVVWESVLDTTFFYPEKESQIFPEPMNGGVLPYGNRNDVLDLDTILSNKMLLADHRCNTLYYYLFAKKKTPNPFYEELMKREFSQTWRCRSPFSDRQVEWTMTYEEQKKLEDFCTNNREQAMREFITEYTERQNRLLSLASNNSDVNIYLTVNDDNFCYHYVFSKEYSKNSNKPISNLKADSKGIYEGINEDLNSLPIFFSQKEICQNTNKSIVFRFVDWNKTDSLEITM